MRKVLTGLAVILVIAGSLPAYAGSSRKPTGHAYSPDQQRLPRLNSRRDRINSRADIYEAEIYRSQRETAIAFGELRRMFDHDLRAGTNFRPRY